MAPRAVLPACARGSILPAFGRVGRSRASRKGANVQLDFSDLFVHPVFLYAGLALGAIGVCYAMPRASRGPRELGGIVAAAGVGLVLLGLLLRGAEHVPNLFFYVFSLIGLGSALRVITHPKPVYAALFFILTVLSSAGLYVLLSAEFLTFALVIIYAGAILITYLFVIMLATQVSSEDAPEAPNESDAVSRAPFGAVLAGFVLLAALTGLFNSGLQGLPAPSNANPDAALEMLPLKVKKALVERGFPETIEVGNSAARGTVINARPNSRFLLVRMDYEAGLPFIKRYHAALAAQEPEAQRAAYLNRLRVVRNGQTEPMFATGEPVEPLTPEMMDLFQIEGRPPVVLASLVRPKSLAEDAEWAPYWTVMLRIPDGVTSVNLERVGFALLAEHPLALELAGVILLMALVGAVVIARKQIQLSEEETDAAAGRSAA